MPADSRHGLLGKSLLLAASLVAAYAMLESCVRIGGLPDPELMRYLDKRAQVGRLEEGRIAAYGWDRDAVEYSNHEGRSGAFTVLFVGDSVTAGYGLKDGPPYPEIVARTLGEKMPVRVINAAVQGFGVDQMLMKVESIAASYAPDVIVFAYIPHDLWRCGRNVNYGVTKPVLVPAGGHGLRVIPAPALNVFLDEYRSAKDWFHVSVWTLRHVTENRRYYFYERHLDYYRALFALIHDKLATLSPRTPLLVVRLPSTWPGDALPVLDDIARASFSQGSEDSRYRFDDVEPCARAGAKAAGLEYSQEFQWHPQAAGHRLLAACLVPELGRLAADRSSR